MRKRVLSALTVVLALLAAGCSDADEQPAGPKATLQATKTTIAELLSWQWTLRNDDDQPIVVLDGPITGGSQPQVWVTAGKDDTVQVAYRFLAPPDGVSVAQPILQIGHTVAAGASIGGTAQVRLPLAVRHPYAGSFDPPLRLPGNTEPVEFCVGVVRAADVAPQPGGAYAHLESAVAKQRLICVSD